MPSSTRCRVYHWRSHLAQCLPARPRMHPVRAPTIFLGVCHAWRNIALSAPSLWATISDEDIPTVNFFKSLEIWLNRTRGLPLSLALRVPAAVRALVERHALRVRNLELSLLSAEDLEQITFPFTSLHSLADENTTNTNTEYFSRNARECVERLRGAPNLVECNFSRVFYQEDNIPNMLTHLSLQHLRLGQSMSEDPHGMYDSTTAILRYLTLLALWALVISIFDITSIDFLSFLTRSSPHLQSLHLWLVDSEVLHMMDEKILEQYLQFLPGLTDLDIGPTSNSMFPLLKVLHTVPDLLPNLRNLKIRKARVNSADYEILRSFRLESTSKELLPDDITVALRQLVQDGMRIYIGTKGRNYL
ncbi:hypothetical protein DFH07DRAFT_938260 [Mycena maculata]|uniref:F-box domain-containing protein n=1 Tax=Mycena maculata TaxID=230809 RepID=A0AAD7NPK2_9AGAR|nr:hypothetical protein DFH07DRAFT_938260 [Mycena maculata]